MFRSGHARPLSAAILLVALLDGHAPSGCYAGCRSGIALITPFLLIAKALHQREFLGTTTAMLPAAPLGRRPARIVHARGHFADKVVETDWKAPAGDGSAIGAAANALRDQGLLQEAGSNTEQRRVVERSE